MLSAEVLGCELKAVVSVDDVGCAELSDEIVLSTELLICVLETELSTDVWTDDGDGTELANELAICMLKAELSVV